MHASSELLSMARVVVEAEKREAALPTLSLSSSFGMLHSRASLIRTQERRNILLAGAQGERPEWAKSYNRQLPIARFSIHAVSHFGVHPPLPGHNDLMTDK